MAEALYAEGGYYAQPAPPIGPRGDFVTGSSLSPLFGRTTARLVRALDRLLGRPADVLEAGYGSGAHLAALLAALEGAGGRRVLGWDRIPRPLPEPACPLERLEELGEGELEGLVFSYELFDALPVHRLIGRPGGVRELGVGLSSAGSFEWREIDLSDPELAALVAGGLEPGQIADLSPAWRETYGALAARLGRGLLVTCDYGFERQRLLDPRVRRHGTLACYRRQRVHRDPFIWVGEQDLTAHVDFSALIGEGERRGFDTLAFTRQAPWLAAAGLLTGLPEAGTAARVEAQELMSLDGMGEEIRVLVQGRGVERRALIEALPGLAHLISASGA